MEQTATDFGILDGVRELVGVCSDTPGDHDLATWMRLVGELSEAMTALAAARDRAIVRLAAIDEDVDEDGVVVEKVNGLGTVCLDAGSIVAVATNTTTTFAEELVQQAVTRVVRVPVLHEAMTTGILDDYQTRCIATELTDVPIGLARAVVDVLAEDMGAKSGPALRRRTQSILYRLSPDLLRERLREARKDLGLERWAGEPGTERWAGSFPSEDAARAWAAIDVLARQLTKQGVCDTLKKARGTALMEIISGRTDVKTVLHLTVPADVFEGADDAASVGGHAEHDLAEDATTEHPTTEHGPTEHGPEQAGATSPTVSADTSPYRRTARPSPSALTATPTRRGPSRTARDKSPADPTRRPAAGSADRSAVANPSPPAMASATPAATISASSDRPSTPGSASGDRPSTPDSATASQVGSGSTGEVFAAVAGAVPTGLSWLLIGARPAEIRAAAPEPGTAARETSRILSAGDVALDATAQATHPKTGALLDSTNSLATAAYRPGRALIQHVRQRDGRCRFPGCSTPARSCDIDHVVPWPRGQTETANLMSLCRRHHRIKQRHRWRVRMLADGRVRWSDPSGTEHTTYPIDHCGARERRCIRVPLSVSPLLPPDSALRPGRSPGGRDGRAEWRKAADREPSVTETFHGIVIEHAIPWDSIRPLGSGNVDYIFRPHRPEGCGPLPRFVLSRKLRKQCRRRARALLREHPDQRNVRVGPPGAPGLGERIHDYGDPPF